jgi:hypothetical protein
MLDQFPQLNSVNRQRPRTVEVMAGHRVQCAGELTERSLKVRRLLREHDQGGAIPPALTISRDPKSRFQPGPHRPGRGGSTPPSCRDWVANFDSEVPALNRRELGANPRQPTISMLP